MTQAEPEFVHRFVPAADAAAPVVLLLLHGTGGDEEDLLPIGEGLWPGAALLSPRGKVSENGMPRFFRRLSEGVFDVEDLKFRAGELGKFVEGAAERYGFQRKSVVAVGYSNGANIASGLMLLNPRVLAGAVLLRPMVPFAMDTAPDLRGVHVLLGAGKRDRLVPVEHIGALTGMFESAGAEVSVHWHAGGHELGEDDLAAAKDWLARQTFTSR